MNSICEGGGELLLIGAWGNGVGVTVYDIAGATPHLIRARESRSGVRRARPRPRAKQRKAARVRAKAPGPAATLKTFWLVRGAFFCRRVITRRDNPSLHPSSLPAAATPGPEHAHAHLLAPLGFQRLASHRLEVDVVAMANRAIDDAVPADTVTVVQKMMAATTGSVMTSLLGM